VRNGRHLLEHEMASAQQAEEYRRRINDLATSQNEMNGRMQAMAESVISQQSAMTKQLDERLNGMTGRIGQSLHDTTKSTHESLIRLQERLVAIDVAQTNITSLTGQVVELQNILANKQTRGAFGQGRMETIVKDALPSSSYAFQATLSNGNRPDCTILMPNGTPPLVIDAKFPLEAWNGFREARTDEFKKAEATRFRRDMDVHVKAISEKYLLPGETQDTAFLFVPSESIFAEIHENFEDIIQKAHRLRIVIVSPSLLMLSIQVVQSVLKDAKMREQAHLIQAEVMKLLDDLGRLDDRVRKLAGHFSQTQKDIDQIVTSADKVAKRGNRLTDMDFSPPTDELLQVAQDVEVQRLDQPSPPRQRRVG
jgi:DNA recombination protein RmuC